MSRNLPPSPPPQTFDFSYGSGTFARLEVYKTRKTTTFYSLNCISKLILKNGKIFTIDMSIKRSKNLEFRFFHFSKILKMSNVDPNCVDAIMSLYQA